MSEQDRRWIQTMLATMGYHSGRIDGHSTRNPPPSAATSSEIKSEMTGPSAEQATRPPTACGENEGGMENCMGLRTKFNLVMITAFDWPGGSDFPGQGNHDGGSHGRC
jgi:hypothetical protein